MTSIGEDAFEFCTSLPSAYNSHIFAYLNRNHEGAYAIPDGIETIAAHALHGCTGLTAVAIPESVTEIGERAFTNCTGLTSITIPKNVTSIGEVAFVSCEGLTSIIVEDGNTVYDSRENCNAIIETSTNVLLAGCQNTAIPESVTMIGFEAFQGCRPLTSVTIPNSVKEIGTSAFAVCAGLTSVTIGEGVTEIGKYAFGQCSNLINLYCYATSVPNTYTGFSGTFEYVPLSNATLHVPEQSLEAYKTTVPWSEFGTIIPLTDEELTDVSSLENSKAEVRDVYDLNGCRLAKMQKGMNIVRMSDGTVRKVMAK